MLIRCDGRKKYVRAGSDFGDAVSYIYMGECVGFKRKRACWCRWEKEYARRGYRTISLDAFIECGGYGAPLQNLGARREANETPVYHAEIYRELYLGKVRPVFTPAEMLDGERVGICVLPSTEIDKQI